MFHIAIMMLFVTGTCSPIERSTSQQATDSDCHGTECEVDVTIPTETVIDVNFAEYLTQAIISALPNTVNTEETLLKNIATTTNAALQRHGQQIKNLTFAVDVLLDKVTTLMETQLNVLNERLPVPPPPARDCQDIALQSEEYVSGPHKITPDDNLGSFIVNCDMNLHGQAWTVLQRRFDGSVNFYRGWDDYIDGFGNPDGEYWAGLRLIRQLTKTGNWILRIDVEDFEGNTAYATYASFQVGDTASYYALSIGVYSGTAGDSLTFHNNQAFSTKDRDHDKSGSNCAESFSGAWWYNDCYYSNLNGMYLGPSEKSDKGNRWYHWKGSKSLKRSEMKMRRVQ